MAKRRIKYLALLISIIIFNHCSSRYSQTEVDQILTPERAFSKTSPISIRIPFGWREIDANDSTFIDLWLISDDYKSSLSLIPLHSDNAKRSFSHWISVSKLSNKMKFKNMKLVMSDEEIVKINEIDCHFYNFRDNDSFYRISIFQFEENYFELTALENNISNDTSSKLQLLNQIQNAVIGSIE